MSKEQKIMQQHFPDLAQEIAGDEEAFASMMNEKADELGMSRTHLYSLFKNEKEPKFSTIVKIFHELGYELEIA